MEEGKKRYAVLVGCNYPEIPDYLDGAVTDVLKMREVLVSRFGFERANIVLLVDIVLPGTYVTEMDVLDSSVSDVGVPAAGSSSVQSTDVFSVDFESPVTPTNLAVPGPPMKPTGMNIKLQLHEMIRRAEPGDVLFFHFSGHGVQIPTTNGTKKTAIAPCDFNLITDEHFRQLVNRLPEGASFTFLSDSCTTGGDLIDKAKEQVGDPSVVISSTPQLPIANHRIRMIPYATVFNHLPSKSNIQSPNINVHLSAIFGNEASRLGLPESDPFGNPLPLESGILLTGCQADGSSVDVPPDHSVGRLEGYGAFSNAVQKVFREHPNRITNKELISLTRVGLGGMQYPCLYCSDGNVDAPFLWQPESELTDCISAQLQHKKFRTVTSLKQNQSIAAAAAAMSNGLPNDLIVDIFLRLPVKSLSRFRCVCKSWCDFIRNPSFVKMHLQRATENQNFTFLCHDADHIFYIESDVVLGDGNDVVVEIDYPFKASGSRFLIEGSCHGLFSITIEVPSRDNSITCIWNPYTQEYKELPTIPMELLEGYYVSQVRRYGFGYDYVNDDYKLVTVFTTSSYVDKSECHEVMVYTLGSDSWRKVDDIPYCLSDHKVSLGKHVNGALHWVADRREGSEMVIFSFDLGSEEYREVPHPNYLDSDFEMNLSVLDECLCAICNFDDIRADIWMMKDYGVKESWTKLFTIVQPTFLEYFFSLSLIKIDKNGEILLNDDNDMNVAYYDLKSGKLRDLEIRCFHEVYVGSLVSLNSGTYVRQSIRREIAG